jgi:hypothetical protein
MASASFSRPSALAAGLPRVGGDCGAESVLQLLLEHGAVVVEDALSSTDLGRVTRELSPWFDAAEYGRGPFFGRRTRRFSGLFAKSEACADLAIHPLALEVMERALKGPDPAAPRCDAIELNLTQAIGIEPGEPPQIFHRDEELWPFAHDFEVMANVMWALDPFTAENGATLLVPGSHRWPRDRWPQAHEIAAAAAPAGSAILWLGGLLHGGGGNGSHRMRRGVVMSYRLGWLVGAERLLLSTPPEVARRLPERVQRLIGYQLHRPNLGWVEGRDPLLWLDERIGPLAAMDDNLTPSLAQQLAAALGLTELDEVA